MSTQLNCMCVTTVYHRKAYSHAQKCDLHSTFNCLGCLIDLFAEICLDWWIFRHRRSLLIFSSGIYFRNFPVQTDFKLEKSLVCQILFSNLNRQISLEVTMKIDIMFSAYGANIHNLYNVSYKFCHFVTTNLIINY